MATLQARFLLAAFIALSVVIVYNAIFLQEGSHPAPMTADGRNSGAAVKARKHALPRVAKTLSGHTETTASLPASKTVATIQRRLAALGYESGPADGLHGDLTRAAIMAFEHDNAMQITGDATDRILKAMILGATPERKDAAGAATMPEETVALVRSVQAALTKLGYDPGPPDGLVGVATAKAIRKFESDKRLPVKGRISGKLVLALMDSMGGTLSGKRSN